MTDQTIKMCQSLPALAESLRQHDTGRAEWVVVEWDDTPPWRVVPNQMREVAPLRVDGTAVPNCFTSRTAALRASEKACRDRRTVRSELEHWGVWAWPEAPRTHFQTAIPADALATPRFRSEVEDVVADAPAKPRLSTATATSAASLNRRLRTLYAEEWGALTGTIPVGGGYSSPLLLSVNAAFVAASKKLLVVGQQTFGWSLTEGIEYPDHPVDALMQLYGEFNRGEHYRQTPFWRTSHQLQTALNPGSEPYGLMWSNLVRVDQNRERPLPIEAALSRIPLLAEEIRILDPAVVVFFTGPDYDDRLKATFPGVRNADSQSFGGLSAAVSRLSHPWLPSATFRTYHPAFLARRGVVASVRDYIVQIAAVDGD